MVSSADPAVSRRDFAAGETGRGPFIPTNRASNPRAGQWTNAMSHNMIADYKRFLMTATNTTTGSKLRSWPI